MKNQNVRTYYGQTEWGKPCKNTQVLKQVDYSTKQLDYAVKFFKVNQMTSEIVLGENISMMKLNLPWRT